MKLIHTDIEGVFIIEPQIFEDSRGYFFESFNTHKFAALTGINTHFVQDNESRSKVGVVRGLHFQLAPYAQSKLVRVVEGEILDIAVDIRRGSPTFGHHVGVVLSGDNHRQLFIPRGFAHGFVVLRGDAVVHYKCDNPYAPAAERAIRWNDPMLNIDFGINPEQAILSAKDSANPLLAQCDELFDYNIDYYV
ncbi:MAG: dTDP-4-dehydrorhamnose 3,5-epimerase [Alistipes sp.]|nr:dTDP-4-dehydrorhamnose 3,5-epimerase [Alistipes sp.]MBQ3198561.1 dTDP-4-dehydrorhamnose 3,5-epimerase [Alistipes sp.]